MTPQLGFILEGEKFLMSWENPKPRIYRNVKRSGIPYGESPRGNLQRSRYRQDHQPCCGAVKICP
jgi:hypothetical protein